MPCRTLLHGGMYQPSTLSVRVTCTVLQLLGVICAVWRICIRLKISRFWWEDAWACVVLLSCVLSLVGEWSFVLTHGLSSNVGFWMYTLAFTCVVRATHLSLAFSIIRILRDDRLRSFTYFLAASCCIFWTVIVSGKIWLCASSPAWHHYKTPACLVDPQILIFEVATNCVTVGILTVLPLCILWKVKLPRRQRRMILSIFASSVVLAFMAIFHMLGRVLSIAIVLVAGVDLEITCSILMCNLLVVVTFFYRFWRRDNESTETTTTTTTDVDDFTQPTRQPYRSPLMLTTVEFGSPLQTTQITTQSHITAPSAGNTTTQRIARLASLDSWISHVRSHPTPS